MKKISLALFFGGASHEYEVSLCSAAAVLRGLCPDRYAVTAVGITRRGRWLATRATPDEIEADAWQTRGIPCLLSPDRGSPGLFLFPRGKKPVRVLPDVLFPVMHGKYGEDGCMQGLFALSGIPYVGCDTRAAAIGMDKATAKTLAQAAGIPVVPWVFATHGSRDKEICAQAKHALGYPVFIKPSRSGSSIGAGIAKSQEELLSALRRAKKIDRDVLIEAYVPAREIEVAVCTVRGRTEVSRPGEITAPTGGFYDYDTKYRTAEATLSVPARLSHKEEVTVRDRARAIYHVFSCRGPARVDFFLPRDGGEIYFNEINTLPGFTAISMFPRLMTEKRSFSALLDEMIAGAKRG